MLAEFGLTILYTQLVVHTTGLERPGLIWDDDHVAQGFAWSPGIVSFGVPDHDGECYVEVDTAPSVAVGPSALWAVRVPFSVPTAPLQIGTIANMRPVNVPAGDYSLVFEAFPEKEISGTEYAFILRLRFCNDAHPDFEILREGDELTTDKVLRRDAEHG